MTSSIKKPLLSWDRYFPGSVGGEKINVTFGGGGREVALLSEQYDNSADNVFPRETRFSGVSIMNFKHHLAVVYRG